ncbi:hypothetical protein KIH79_05465 [Bifidobacterium sp. 82T10]|uniref:Uncharacterized protein n=1 Tax=Bifidobacterium miconis TaxID=2834435 RepID=A0ABS6WEC4_9BIFI|nr:hypothetical protein [Bifidobacterium miconis]MBW3092399.1 hypothetical protein [Bifidobacterium miconis]
MGAFTVACVIALVVAVAVLAIVGFYLWDVLPVKRLIVARLKSTTELDKEDLARVHFTLFPSHAVSWPREWTTPEQANERGGGLLNELWPDELPLPATADHTRWTQRTKKVE